MWNGSSASWSKVAFKVYEVTVSLNAISIALTGYINFNICLVHNLRESCLSQKTVHNLFSGVLIKCFQSSSPLVMLDFYQEVLDSKPLEGVMDDPNLLFIIVQSLNKHPRQSMGEGDWKK